MPTCDSTDGVFPVSPARQRRSCGEFVVLTTFVLSGLLAGCETDSWFDPSRTGYFEPTPSTMPVLNRLDVIERETTTWKQTSRPTADDLQPGELQYRLSAGDEVRVEVFELVTPNQTDVALRIIDPSGNIRLPTIGDVPAAGNTVAQLQKDIEDRLRGYITDPIVSVILERGQGFSFVVHGAVQDTGLYSLTRPDFRLMDALALARGTFSTTERIYVIRSAGLYPELQPNWPGRQPNPTPNNGTPTGPKPEDLDAIINRLKNEGGAAPTTPPPPTPPQPEPEKPAMGALGPAQDAPKKDDTKPPVDVDELSRPKPPTPPPTPSPGEGWMWDAQKQMWVRGGAGSAAPSGGSTTNAPDEPQQSMYATRIIEIDYQALAHGESNYNIIIRPGDRIYVDPPVEGVVYIDGEISRAGVYELPRTGGQLTLSRLVAAAGGLSQLAIPMRVDLVRKVGPGREAAIRVNLAAIRNRNDPDIVLKPDDHIIIGTNFFATPLAVIRNGFRMTYGFGFLLDRNFGNDVFGAPPTNFLQQPQQ